MSKEKEFDDFGDFEDPFEDKKPEPIKDSETEGFPEFNDDFVDFEEIPAPEKGNPNVVVHGETEELFDDNKKALPEQGFDDQTFEEPTIPKKDDKTEEPTLNKKILKEKKEPLKMSKSSKKPSSMIILASGAVVFIGLAGAGYYFLHKKMDIQPKENYTPMVAQKQIAHPMVMQNIASNKPMVKPTMDMNTMAKNPLASTQPLVQPLAQANSNNTIKPVTPNGDKTVMLNNNQELSTPDLSSVSDKMSQLIIQNQNLRAKVNKLTKEIQEENVSISNLTALSTKNSETLSKLSKGLNMNVSNVLSKMKEQTHFTDDKLIGVSGSCLTKGPSSSECHRLTISHFGADISYNIGDSIPGVGVIKSLAKMPDGKWEVITSNGYITE